METQSVLDSIFETISNIGGFLSTYSSNRSSKMSNHPNVVRLNKGRRRESFGVNTYTVSSHPPWTFSSAYYVCVILWPGALGSCSLSAQIPIFPPSGPLQSRNHRFAPLPKTMDGELICDRTDLAVETTCFCSLLLIELRFFMFYFVLKTLLQVIVFFKRGFLFHHQVPLS